jgi:hypothetical protein
MISLAVIRTVPRALRRPQQRRRRLLHRLGHRPHRPRRRRRHQPGGRAREQRLAQIRLKCRDVPPQRRLRQPQPPRRGRKAAAAQHGQEGADQGPVGIAGHA